MGHRLVVPAGPQQRDRLGTAVVRTGTNLNQAVAALNATGQAPVWLVTVASMCARTLAGVDEVISAIDARVRR